MSNAKTVCFAGHRPKQLCGYDRDAYTDFVSKLADFCTDLYDKGYTTFITGGAQGIDQLAFWAVNSLKEGKHLSVLNKLYLPFPDFGNKWSRTGLFSQQQLNTIASLANDIKVIANTPETSTNAISALMKRNKAMIDDSDLLVAVYENDYRWVTDKGGTAQAIRYARSQNKDVIIITYNADDIRANTLLNKPSKLHILDIIKLTETPRPTSDEYLLISGQMLDSKHKGRYMSDIDCFIDTEKKLFVEANDYDGYHWYYGKPLENIINKMTEENARYIYNLLKAKLDD